MDENSTKPVHARELGVTYKYKFNEAFEAGFGASWIRFSGDGFSTFDRFLLTPLIVAFRPLATATKEPWGRVVAEAAHDEPGVIVAEIDPAQSLAARRKIPNLKNAREFAVNAGGALRLRGAAS